VPETPEAARLRFLRAARQAVNRLTAQGRPNGFAEFETRIAGALGRLQSHLRPDRPEDLAALAAGGRLLGARYALLRRWEQDHAVPSTASANTRVSDNYAPGLLECGRHRTFPEHRKQVIRDAA